MFIWDIKKNIIYLFFQACNTRRQNGEADPSLGLKYTISLKTRKSSVVHDFVVQTRWCNILSTSNSEYRSEYTKDKKWSTKSLHYLTWHKIKPKRNKNTIKKKYHRKEIIQLTKLTYILLTNFPEWGADLYIVKCVQLLVSQSKQNSLQCVPRWVSLHNSGISKSNSSTLEVTLSCWFLQPSGSSQSKTETLMGA